jgi:hypothetical protein
MKKVISTGIVQLSPGLGLERRPWEESLISLQESHINIDVILNWENEQNRDNEIVVVVVVVVLGGGE